MTLFEYMRLRLRLWRGNFRMVVIGWRMAMGDTDKDEAFREGLKHINDGLESLKQKTSQILVLSFFDQLCRFLQINAKETSAFRALQGECELDRSLEKIRLIEEIWRLTDEYKLLLRNDKDVFVRNVQKVKIQAVLKELLIAYGDYTDNDRALP